MECISALKTVLTCSPDPIRPTKGGVITLKHGIFNTVQLSMGDNISLDLRKVPAHGEYN